MDNTQFLCVKVTVSCQSFLSTLQQTTTPENNLRLGCESRVSPAVHLCDYVMKFQATDIVITNNSNVVPGSVFGTLY